MKAEKLAALLAVFGLALLFALLGALPVLANGVITVCPGGRPPATTRPSRRAWTLLAQAILC